MDTTPTTNNKECACGHSIETHTMHGCTYSELAGCTLYACPCLKRPADLDSLIVLDGMKGISMFDALKFLDGKRALLDANSSANEYLTLSLEYDSIGAMDQAAEMWQKYEALHGV